MLLAKCCVTITVDQIKKMLTLELYYDDILVVLIDDEQQHDDEVVLSFFLSSDLIECTALHNVVSTVVFDHYVIIVFGIVDT